MEIVTISEDEYLSVLKENNENISICSDQEALFCYKNREIIKVCNGQSNLAVFIIPISNGGVRRNYRFFPYCIPILLKELNNVKQKEVYKTIFNYLFNKYDYTFIPLHPKFKMISSICSEDGFVEMRHTHILTEMPKFNDLNSKLKNHIRYAKKRILSIIDVDYSNFDYDLAIKGNIEEKKERKNLAKILLKNKKSFLVKAYYDKSIVAGIQIIYDDECAYLLHSYQKEKIRGTIPLLIYKSITECFEKLNVKYFDFEGSVIEEIDDFFSSFNAHIVTYPYVIQSQDEKKFYELIKRSKNIEGRVNKIDEKYKNHK